MAYGNSLLPLLQRAIAELSENLCGRPDAEQRRRLIAFFRKTIDEAEAATQAAQDGTLVGRCAEPGDERERAYESSPISPADLSGSSPRSASQYAWNCVRVLS